MHEVRWLITTQQTVAPFDWPTEVREVSHETLPGRCIHPGDLPPVGDYINFARWKYRVASRHWSWEPTPDGCLCSLAIVLEVVGELTPEDV